MLSLKLVSKRKCTNLAVPFAFHSSLMSEIFKEEIRLVNDRLGLCENDYMLYFQFCTSNSWKYNLQDSQIGTEQLQ